MNDEIDGSHRSRHAVSVWMGPKSSSFVLKKPHARFLRSPTLTLHGRISLAIEFTVSLPGLVPCGGIDYPNNQRGRSTLPCIGYHHGWSALGFS